MIKQMLIITLLLFVEDLFFFFAFKKQAFLDLESRECHGGIYALKLFAVTAASIIVPRLAMNEGALIYQVSITVLLTSVIAFWDYRDKSVNKWIYDFTFLVNVFFILFMFADVTYEETSLYHIVYALVISVFAAIAAVVYSGIKTNFNKNKRLLWQKIVFAVASLFILFIVYNGLEILIKFEDLKELIPTA